MMQTYRFIFHISLYYFKLDYFRLEYRGNLVSLQMTVYVL
jgi:hypothetical protein